MIHSYPSIYAFGHAEIDDLLNHPVIVEEKIDGSQISFWKREDGELEMRSKGAQINMFAPEGMFNKAVEYAKSVADMMVAGIVYRGEFLAKPKHNVLCYNRVPRNNIIIFDADDGQQAFAKIRTAKEMLAEGIGLETVPLIYSGMITSPEQIREFLELESCLGGQKIEGVVIKPADYDLWGKDKKLLMGKFVSEHFKEVHKKEWKQEHATPSQGDIIKTITDQYTNAARWQKAIIHAAEAGTLQNAPQDIGPLMKDIPDDILKECEDEIKEILFKWAWPQIRRQVTHGFPDWYKDQLLKKQFESA